MEGLRRAVVITSIFPPTDAVRSFAAFDRWKLIVVGDRKTPPSWSHPGVHYLGVTDQETTSYRLARALPWNHYCRKMVGYLYAIERGAEVIADTDDDNLPYADWDFPPFAGNFEYIEEDKGFVNIYRSFTEQHIWPRGFPLDRILSKDAVVDEVKAGKELEVGVWQALADDDPDVDAIYRLTNNQPCYFEARSPIVLQHGTICPFNSQNTLFARALFPLLYLPAHVTFRFTDILRGLVAQPIMWLYEKHLGFTKATVRQARNPHDYMKDFASEIPCYLHPLRVVEVVSSAVTKGRTIEGNLLCAYEALHKENIVPAEELVSLATWIDDLRAVTPDLPDK